MSGAPQTVHRWKLRQLANISEGGGAVNSINPSSGSNNSLSPPNNPSPNFASGAVFNLDSSRMPYVDRTLEFSQLVEQLSSSDVSSSSQGHVLQQQSNRQQEQPARLLSGAEQFSDFAGRIGEQLNATERKLRELNKLARQRQIFNDNTAQVQELTFDIKQSLTDLNSHIDAFSQEAERSADASQRGGSASHHHRAHYQNMSETLRTRLLQVTKDFKDTLELRTKNMRQQDQRRSMYSASPTDTSSSTTSMFNSAASSRGLDLESGGQQSLQLAERGNLYTQSRAVAMENVQRVIGELGEIFGKVATMVTHQEEMVRRIDEDVDNTMTNMKEGEAHLLKYFQTISSSRSLILKVFAIIFLFIVFFVVFLA